VGKSGQAGYARSAYGRFHQPGAPGPRYVKRPSLRGREGSSPRNAGLVAHAFLGALENMQMRASWDNAYTKQDVIRNLLAMFTAVRAAYAGRVELTEEWETVAGLVERPAASAPQPPGPPAKC